MSNRKGRINKTHQKKKEGRINKNRHNFFKCDPFNLASIISIPFFAFLVNNVKENERVLLFFTGGGV